MDGDYDECMIDDLVLYMVCFAALIQFLKPVHIAATKLMNWTDWQFTVIRTRSESVQFRSVLSMRREQDLSHRLRLWIVSKARLYLWIMYVLGAWAELTTGRVHPRVGSGRVMSL